MARAERGPFIAKMAGVVAARQERKSARGNRFAFVQLSDPTGGYEVTLFSEVLEASRDHLEPGAQVVIRPRRRWRPISSSCCAAPCSRSTA